MGTNGVGSFAASRPVGFALSATITWCVLTLVFTGIASSVLAQPYECAAACVFGRLAVTACVLLMAWRLGWLQASGIGRLGSLRCWRAALASLIYFACASLYSLYGDAIFDGSILQRLPAARAAFLAQFAVGLSEEILFRGVVLHGFVRVWGKTKQGRAGSVAVTSLFFAVLHLAHILTYGASNSSAALLAAESFMVSIWWGALALVGRSIWPGVIFHSVLNAVVAAQGLASTVIGSDVRVYALVLCFSVPLGAAGILLLARPVRGRFLMRHAARWRWGLRFLA